jgi:hypothetical protein
MTTFQFNHYKTVTYSTFVYFMAITLIIILFADTIRIVQGK